MSDADSAGNAALKRRLDAQERAISMIAAYMQHDSGWEVFRDGNLSNWLQATQANTAISDEDRKASTDSLAETSRLLKPPTKTHSWS
ncbi:MAG: hypothetical protein ACAH20_21385 [Methylobacteriaceae bacterium]